MSHTDEEIAHRQWDRTMERLVMAIHDTARKVAVEGREPGVDTAARVAVLLTNSVGGWVGGWSLEELIRAGRDYDQVTSAGTKVEAA